MIEEYSTVLENGREYAEAMAQEFRNKGFKVSPIEETMVPRYENQYVRGFRFTVDDGKPPYRPIIESSYII